MTLRTSFAFIIISLGINISTLRAQDAANDLNKTIEKIVGTWKIQKILSGTKVVAKNPTSGQWIEFKSDGKYVNQSTSLDSGSYLLDENQSILFLESSVHKSASRNSPKEIGEWVVAFHEDTMTLLRKRSKLRTDKMKYIYFRISGGPSAANH